MHLNPGIDAKLRTSTRGIHTVMYLRDTTIGRASESFCDIRKVELGVVVFPNDASNSGIYNHGTYRCGIQLCVT